MNSILFISGDVGGARAILPVIQLAAAKNNECHVIWHGYIKKQEKIPGVQYHPIGESASSCDLCVFFKTNAVDVLVFTTSVSDELPIKVASAAKAASIPIAHLLDNWTNYIDRLLFDGLPVIPELYAVMDDHASSEAIRSGVPENVVKVTGTPALALESTSTFPDRDNRSCRDNLNLAFVSEPVVQDQGESAFDPKYRGYTEKTVLKQLLSEVKRLPQKITLYILPHPREDVQILNSFWNSIRGNIDGCLVKNNDKEHILQECDGVIGMASILLYESWLRGKPVLSLQPELMVENLRFISFKANLSSCFESKAMGRAVRLWLDSIPGYRRPAESFAEADNHVNAASIFLDNVLMLKTATRERLL